MTTGKGSRSIRSGRPVGAGRGGILNVSSLSSFQPIPSMATYAATKAFVSSFTEALHEELLGTDNRASADFLRFLREAAAAGRTRQFRESTRAQRIEIAREPREKRFATSHRSHVLSSGTSKADAWAAIPSRRPVKPRPSVVVALTLTRPGAMPIISARRSIISALGLARPVSTFPATGRAVCARP